MQHANSVIGDSVEAKLVCALDRQLRETGSEPWLGGEIGHFLAA